MTGSVDASPATGVDDVVRVAVREGLALPGVCRVGVALVEGGGRRLQFTASDRDPADGPAWCHIDAYDDVPVTDVVRAGGVVASAFADLPAVRPAYAPYAARQVGTPHEALMVVPLPGRGDTRLGGLVLIYDEPQRFDAAQVADAHDRALDLAARVRAAQVHAPRRADELVDEPVPDDARVADTVVPPEPRAVSLGRRFVRQQLDGWGVDEDTVDTVVLCLSELVTNAVVHTQSPAEVRVVLDDAALTLTVRDQGGPRRPPASSQGMADPLAVHGRGLRLVEALSTRWGSELDDSGTTVWVAWEH